MVDTGQNQVLPLQKFLQMGPEMLRIEKLTGQNGFLLVFIGIKGSDPLFGGAVFFVLQPGFLQSIQLAMPGQQLRRCSGVTRTPLERTSSISVQRFSGSSATPFPRTFTTFG